MRRNTSSKSRRRTSIFVFLCWAFAMSAIGSVMLVFSLHLEYSKSENALRQAISSESLDGTKVESVNRFQQSTSSNLAIPKETKFKPSSNSPSSTSPCCGYRTKANFTSRFTQEFFDLQMKESPHLWEGNEYQNWLNFSSTPRGKEINTIETNDCEVQWQRVVMNEVDGYYLRDFFIELRTEGFSHRFKHIEDAPKKPRILLMGDSNSQGTWMWTQAWFGSLANIHSAPTSCYAFDQYKSSLNRWLGDCQWDLIQFNIGMHFHPSEENGLWQPYIDGLKMIVEMMRAHSPNAHIVFATTTPSPVDMDPMPTPEGCGEAVFYSFRQRGHMSAMNDIAKTVFAELGVTVVDRYAAIHPRLGEFMLPCNVHYTVEGYQFLAKTEWETFSKLLDLPLWPPSA